MKHTGIEARYEAHCMDEVILAEISVEKNSNIGRMWGEMKLIANSKTWWKVRVEALCLLRGQED